MAELGNLTQSGISGTYSGSTLPPFGAMAAQKSDALSQLGDIAGKIADTVSILKAPSGTRLPAGYGVAAPVNLGGANQGGAGSLSTAKPFYTNPLVIAGGAVLAAVLIMQMKR